MPWSAKDVEKHIKNLSPVQKAAWVRVANSVLKDSGDEGKAVRIANSQAKKAK